MIEKLDVIEHTDNLYDRNGFITNVACGGATISKVNELIDAINTIQKEREAERFEIQEWIGILEAVRKSVNVHEKQIDDLQMKVEPKKCEIRSENVQDELERTHKALDKAKNGLKELKDIIACPPDVSYETCVSMYADGVLQEITALEQKDVK